MHPQRGREDGDRTAESSRCSTSLHASVLRVADHPVTALRVQPLMANQGGPLHRKTAVLIQPAGVLRIRTRCAEWIRWSAPPKQQRILLRALRIREMHWGALIGRSHSAGSKTPTSPQCLLIPCHPDAGQQILTNPAELGHMVLGPHRFQQRPDAGLQRGDQDLFYAVRWRSIAQVNGKRTCWGQCVRPERAAARFRDWSSPRRGVWAAPPSSR